MKKRLLFTTGILFLFCSLSVYAAVPMEFIAETESKAAERTSPEKEKAGKYFKRGKLLFEKKEYQKALRFFAAAYKLDKENSEALKHIAFSYYQMRRHNRAYAYFKKVLEIFPEDKDAEEFKEFYKNVISKKRKRSEKREIIDSVWRAAALPGWGQMYNHQMLKGILVSSGTLLSAGLTVYNIADYNLKTEKYENANENHDLAFQEAEDAGKKAVIFGIITAAVYIAGIVDAGINYDSQDARLAYEIRPCENGIVVSGLMRF